MINKVLIAITLFAFCLGSHSANCQISGRKVMYKFEDPYFMGEGFSKFLYTKITLMNRDFDIGVNGQSVFTFLLTKDSKIKNMVVVDSTSNENFNKQAYDAVADYPKSWNLATLNGKPIDINMRVTIKFAKISNTGSMASGSVMGRQVFQGRDMYNTIGDYEYLVDNLLSDNFYQEGVKASEENNFKEAIKYFDEVIGFSAEEVDALYSRGICKYKSDDKAGACEDWKKIQSSGKPDADKLILKYCGN